MSPVNSLQKALSLPDYYLSKVDSLIQAKAQLLQDKIKQIGTSGKTQSIDTLGIADLAFDSKITEVNQLINKYSLHITDPEELTWIGNYIGQLQQVEGIVQQYQNKLLRIDELSTLQVYQQQLQQLSLESQGYFQELEQLLDGGLAEDSPLMKSLESKIGMSTEFQELQKQTAALEKVKNMPADYQKEYSQYQDKDYVKEQAVKKAKELAAKFAQNQDQIKAAQNKLAAYKKKYSSIQSTTDMSTAVKRNSLEGKPLGERLVIGGTLQVNKDPTAVDISPLLGYKLNKRYTIGLGITYRAILDFDQVETENQVYGFRSFLQIQAVKGFFLHGEYERMNIGVPLQNPADDVLRRWTGIGLLGIGKQYGLVKNIKGQVMILYNLMHEDHLSPYEKPFIIRFGFML